MSAEKKIRSFNRLIDRIEDALIDDGPGVLVDSLPFPAVLESLGWLRPESPLTVTVVDNYALIYGRADTILPSEPCGIDVGRMTAEASNARWAARARG